MNLPSDEDRAAEEKAIGAVSALGKITQAGYASLDVCTVHPSFIAPLEDITNEDGLAYSLLHLRS